MQDTHRRNKITEIYERLLDFFGPQGWWPVYSDNGPGYHPGDYSYPRTEKQRVEIAFGAILTQQCSWKNAEKAIFSLISRELIDLKRIVEIDVETLQNLVRSSGYFRQKSLRLKEFSSFVLTNYGDMESLLSLDTDTLRKELLSVRGIGKESADSIMLYAGKKPVFVVDAYTFRLAERTGIAEERNYDFVQSLFETNIQKVPEIYGEYHALIVELGKKYCRRVPECTQCPISKLCSYNKKF